MRSWYMLLFQFEGVAEQWIAEQGDVLLGAHPDGAEVRRRWDEPGALTASLGWYRANAHPRGIVGDPPPVPAVTVPVMGVWSTGDMAMTEQQMTGSAEWVEGPWRYERVDAPSHWMQLAAPERVTALLREFLAS
jgi:pimeloyl-ACP methyl ester carboxylesterase